MDNQKSLLPVAAVAVVIVLVAGVSGLAMRTPAAPTASVPVEPVAPESPRDFPRNQGPAVSASGMDQQDLIAQQMANASKVAEAGEKKLRSQFENERVDTGWAAGKQQALEQLSISPQITQLNAEPLAIAASCRSSICLIEADFPSQLAAVDWHTLYTLNAGKEMSNSSMRSALNPDGTVHVQIYGLARQ